MTLRSKLLLLGLFPALDETGGIQASGRAAWEGLVAPHAGAALLFCYGGTGGPPPNGQLPDLHAASKAAALWRIFRARPRPRAVLIWHLGLLKLLPFVRAASARVILFLHGIEAWQPHGPFTHALLHRVDLFLTNSDYTWRRFLHYAPALAGANHRTVQLGLDAPFDGPTPAPAPRPIALVISRLATNERYKGHDALIAAWPLVLQRLPDAQLWIAGDGALRSDLQCLAARLGVGYAVRFWGWVSEDQKQDLLRQARCLVMPSRKEGFGLVYLEAMRLGRPCLVSTLDAGREVVNPPEAGLAADPRDPGALADAVCRLLTPGPAWDAWSRQARARYEARFTARHFQHRLLAALASFVPTPSLAPVQPSPES